TLSFWAISEIGRFLPLKKNAEVRAATRRPGTLASTSSRSSLIPSEKYSLLCASLRSVKARTATDLSLACGAGAADGADFFSATGWAGALTGISFAAGRSAMEAMRPSTTAPSVAVAHSGKPDFVAAGAAGAAGAAERGGVPDGAGN